MSDSEKQEAMQSLNQAQYALYDDYKNSQQSKEAISANQNKLDSANDILANADKTMTLSDVSKTIDASKLDSQ